MDLYAGTLTRYYAHNWKTEAQLWAEENGFGYQKIGPDSEPGEEMSSEEIRQAVEKWRDNLLSAIREHGSRIGSWPEDNEHPYLTNAPSLWKLYCRDNPILAEIPEAFDRLQVFEHDARYEYRTETDPTTGEERTAATDMGRGWWYPGEPEKGAHIR